MPGLVHSKERAVPGALMHFADMQDSFLLLLLDRYLFLATRQKNEHVT